MLNLITRIADAVRPAPRERVLRRAAAGSTVRVRRETLLALVGITLSPAIPLVLLASVKPGQETAIVRLEGRGNYDVPVEALSPLVEFPGWDEARRRIAPRPTAVRGPIATVHTVTEIITTEPVRA